MLNTIKNHLAKSILTILSQKEKYLLEPKKQFTRKRALSM